MSATVSKQRKELDSVLNLKVETLETEFRNKYGKKADFIARAPGRINLIGEHIDYMGYGVFPFALEQDCLIAVSIEREQGHIQLSHCDSKTYPETKISKYHSEKIDFVDNYVKYFWCGYRAALDENLVGEPVGLNVLIVGYLPVASGLSSSASLVVCSGILALRANQLESTLTRTQFIERLIKYERESGTASGGMDQSIIMLGRQNQAFYITFNPLNGEPCPLPKNVSFVVCQSLVKSAKLEEAPKNYNMRVCECRIAMEYISKKFQLGGKKFANLLEIQKQLGLKLQEMADQVVRASIPAQNLTKEAIEKDLGLKLAELLSDIPLYERVLEQNEFFKPLNRALHVFAEAERVLNFRQACLDGKLDEAQRIQRLGQLMNESQESCDKLYECSHSQLNTLTELARSNGAWGSRLTGAGWGGCTISMISKGDEQKFIKSVVESYYSKLDLSHLKLEDVIFSTSPCDGAFLILE